MQNELSQNMTHTDAILDQSQAVRATAASPRQAASSWFLRFATRKESLSLMDQAIVSATNFLTSVLVGRFCGSAELGVYSLGFTVFMVVLCLQDGLLTTPYNILHRRIPTGRQRTFAGSMLVHFSVFALAACLILLVTGSSLILRDGDHSFWLLLCVLGFAIPFIMLREFCRRFSFARLRMGTALFVDAAVMTLQLGGLCALALIGELSAVRAQIVIGIACAFAGVSALWMMRGAFRVERQNVVPDFRRNLKIAKWSVGGQLVSVAHGFVVYWVLAIFLNTAATGAFAACMTVVMLANPLLLGVSNFLGPHTAKAYAEEGRRAVMRGVWRMIVWTGSALLLFSVIVILFGGTILDAIYGGEFHHFAPTLVVLSFAVLAGGVSILANQGLNALERTDIGFISSIAGLATTVVVSVVMMSHWGVFGAACGYLAGSSVSLIVRLAAFIALTRTQEAHQ